LKGKVRFGVLGAFVALAGAFGMVTSHKAADQVDAQIPVGLQVAKTCGATNIAINGTTTCTVTIQATAAVAIAEPIVLTVTNAQASGTGTNPEFGRVLLLAGTSGATGPDVDSVQVNNPTNGLAQTITIGCTGVTCDFAVGDTITITENLQGRVGGPTQETLRFGANVAVQLTPAVTVGPATVAVAANGCVLNAGSTNVYTCSISLTDNDLFPTVVSSGNITLNLTSPGLVFDANGTTSLAVGCGNTQNSPQSCSTVTFAVRITTPPANIPPAGLPVSVSVNYQPDLPAVDFPNVFNVPFANIVQNTQVALFRQPDALRLTCNNNIIDPVTGATPTVANPAPSQIGGVNVIAFGQLPSAVFCTVQPIIGNAVATVAPGTIEVSAVQGGILDATGRFATTLNIGCDNGTIPVVAGTTLDPNVCTGVQFYVSGLGVGITEVRARYLPSSAAVAAGIQERDTRGNVGFIAPQVAVSLLLNPNPIAIGQTGTATARFNRSTNCATLFGGTIAGGTTCIDPTSGQPIVFNFGSLLNGNVNFTIDNTAIAQFTNTTAAPLSSPQTQGFIATANQAIRRCGLFPTVGIPSGPGYAPAIGATPLSIYFGGCESVTVGYQGVQAGLANISATFVPDLPGAFGNAQGVTGTVAALLGFFNNNTNPLGFNTVAGFNVSVRTLEVVAAPPSGTVQLARGCNNVSPTVSETATAYAARVSPAAALVAIWEHQAATNTFRGFSPQAGAPNDLASVTRLRPVFVCVSGAATLDQPAA
jgi:hypothetical protein